jgi:CheY-like chemotaxis protein
VQLIKLSFFMNRGAEEHAVILVVEDEPLLLRFCTAQLQAAGFVVLSAATGEMADRLMQTNDIIHVLFTDIRLPTALDGWDIAELFKSRFPTSGIIYATAYSPDEPRQVRGSLFFRKPYAMADVVKAARELMAHCRLIGGE